MKENIGNLGAFVISNNVLKGKTARFIFRKFYSNINLNGWTIYSIDDDEKYVSNPLNFSVVNYENTLKLVPQIKDIVNAKIGTDLALLYDEENNFTGFYDVTKQDETTIEKILSI